MLNTKQIIKFGRSTTTYVYPCIYIMIKKCKCIDIRKLFTKAICEKNKVYINICTNTCTKCMTNRI